MRTPAGYQWLIEQYRLRALPLTVSCSIESSVRGRTERDLGTGRLFLFEPGYEPEASLPGQLQFALRYEGVNLQVLALLFEQAGETELSDWLKATPASSYARRACFLYEWLTGRALPVADVVPAKTRYAPALDPEQQFAAKGRRSERFKVLDNLPGNPNFCPLVRRTASLNQMIGRDLRARTRETLQKYDPDLLRRAAAYLYLKETQSSFEVEREKPSADRAQRFSDLLREADTREPLTEERLAELQQAVVDPRFHEFTWRGKQNWIGKDLGYRQQIDFVPARPEDLPDLMKGLLDMAGQARLEEFGDPVVNAAAIAFGFVFVHPFMDGNGRIHRYLIHEVLANAGFTPRGIVLPVSAVILANLDDYIEVLEAFSRPLRRMTEYSPDAPEISARGNDAVFFRYLDATPQAEFLYRALERTVEEDLQQEINYLLGFDRAFQNLNRQFDWPDHSLELFIRIVHHNQGELSKAKRKSHFDWMTDEEVVLAANIVRESFTEFGDAQRAHSEQAR